MTVIESLVEAAATVRQHVLPATVSIGRGGRGAGFVLSDGYVVTNAHNLRGAETTIGFADGRQAVGSVAGVDADGDLAVLAVDTTGAAALAWADGPETRAAGTPVWTATNPVGGAGRVTFGTISAVDRAFRGPGGRPIANGVEHTAPLARGSSGGPVVDAYGHLVGINTHRMGDGFYLAIPADSELRSRLDALAAGQSPSRIHLGVALAPPEAARRLRAAVGLPARDGLLVRGVEDGSPARRGGVQRGDLLVEAGGRPLGSLDDLYAALGTLSAGGGSVLALTVVRGADELRIDVTFDAAPSPEDGPPADAP